MRHFQFVLNDVHEKLPFNLATKQAHGTEGIQDSLEGVR